MALKRVAPCLYKYQSSGVYFAHVRASGKLHRRSLETTDRQLANRRLVEFRRRLSRVDSGLGRTTLAAMCGVYLQTIEHRSHSTKKARRGIIARLKKTFYGVDALPLGDIKPSQIATWLSKQAGQLSASHYNTFVTTLRDIFALAVRDRYIADSPLAEFKYRKREQPIRLTPSFDEFTAIVTDIRAQQFNADAKDSANFVEFIGLAGVGQAEAAGLTRKHVHFDKGQIQLFRYKTRQAFTIPVFPQVQPLLERLCEGLKADDRVFPINGAKKAIAGACSRLGLPHYTHRSFRRMFITRAIELGVDVKVIAEWQGHRDGGKLILDTYSHVNRAHSQRMAQLMTDGPTREHRDVEEGHCVKPPTDSWDEWGWLCYLQDWKDDWPSPGGLDYENFSSKFTLSVVPDGWIKPGYGPTAQGKQRKDIGKGHAAFLRMYRTGVFDSLAESLKGNGQEIQVPRGVVDYFFRESINAIVSDDAKFFSDFWQAVEHWHDCVKTGAPLLDAKKGRPLEFMILTTILEDGEPFYSVTQLRKLVLKRFFPDKNVDRPTSKDIDKVMNRLGIKKCRRN